MDNLISELECGQYKKESGNFFQDAQLAREFQFRGYGTLIYFVTRLYLYC